MKGLLKDISLALILGLTAINTSSASVIGGGYSTTEAIGNVVLVTMHGIESKTAYVSLYDAEGEELWSDILRNQSIFRKQFNMGSLPDGMYKIVLKDGDVTRTHEIKKSIDKVYVVSMNSETLLKPETTLVNKRLIVSYPEAVSKVLSVKFIDAFGETFFNDEVEFYNSRFEKGYVVKSLPAGYYTVVIKTSQKTFYKEMTLNKK